MTLDERIGRYLDRCPAAVSGQDGHGTAFKVACALVNGFALSPEEALRHFEHYNVRCAPPWKPRELRHKLEQAAKVNHEKPRGHLLGVNGFTRGPHEAVQAGPKLVPVRLTPRKRRFGTLRTVVFNPCADAGAHTHAGTCVYGTQKQSSQPSDTLDTLDGLVFVPGCKTPRPEQIAVSDATWRAIDAAGFADNPHVQNALFYLGPDCTVVSINGQEVGA